MRISRLDLLRYGHFTDLSIGFPLCAPDIHIIFGPNEAGKSTALSALGDFLFGISHNSPYNFLHDYGDLRIGAMLETDGRELSARRRKGNKDTLLTLEDQPIAGGEGALAPFLSGIDRTFHERMFSLDHLRLRQGGREILEARDEVGQMLFSASTGIAGIRDRIRKLDAEADGLWGPRRSAKRRYSQEEDRFKEADKRLRETMVSAKKWLDLKQAYEGAQRTHDGLEESIRGQVRRAEEARSHSPPGPLCASGR